MEELRREVRCLSRRVAWISVAVFPSRESSKSAQKLSEELLKLLVEAESLVKVLAVADSMRRYWLGSVRGKLSRAKQNTGKARWARSCSSASALSGVRTTTASAQAPASSLAPRPANHSPPIPTSPLQFPNRFVFGSLSRSNLQPHSSSPDRHSYT
jgi:hypothetical protein